MRYIQNFECDTEGAGVSFHYCRKTTVLFLFVSFNLHLTSQLICSGSEYTLSTLVTFLSNFVLCSQPASSMEPISKRLKIIEEVKILLN